MPSMTRFLYPLPEAGPNPNALGGLSAEAIAALTNIALGPSAAPRVF